MALLTIIISRNIRRLNVNLGTVLQIINKQIHTFKTLHTSDKYILKCVQTNCKLGLHLLILRLNKIQIQIQARVIHIQMLNSK